MRRCEHLTVGALASIQPSTESLSEDAFKCKGAASCAKLRNQFFASRVPNTEHLDASRFPLGKDPRGSNRAEPCRYRVFNRLGPVVPRCAGAIESYGSGDDEKRACALTRLRAPCTVISIGSKGQWGFEEEVMRLTPCRVETFDCTVSTDVRPPPLLRERVTLHRICIGARTYSDNSSRIFMDYHSIMRYLGITTEAPAYMKMDIEGFEFGVLLSAISRARSLAARHQAGLRETGVGRLDKGYAIDVHKQLAYGNGSLLPKQLAMEVHRFSPKWASGLPFWGRHITGHELTRFMAHIYREAGYELIDRHDHPWQKCMSEILISREY